MTRNLKTCLTAGRLMGAAAALLALPFSATVGHAIFPDNLAAPAVTTQCNPAALTRPQPTFPSKQFSELVLYKGCLSQPTAVAFAPAPDNRVFVAEKSGMIKVCDDVDDVNPPSCQEYADLSSEVHNADDRGLLGLALDPHFADPANPRPYVYVLYTTTEVSCPNDNTQNCTHGRLSRLAGPAGGATETPILEETDWCFQFTSHSIGGLAFGSDGALYVSAGDGASFNEVDYGQLDNNHQPNNNNVCNDPFVVTTLAQDEGGALRSQGVRWTWPGSTGSGLVRPDNTTNYDGAMLRINPITGEAFPGNPLIGSGIAGADRVIAYGFRNPFRFAIQPGKTDVYVGNVGWDTWEAIDHIITPTQINNFGWPCYEGPNLQPLYSTGQLSLCPANGVSGVTPPFFSYNHFQYVTPEDSKGKACGAHGKPGPDSNGSVISAIGFTDGSSATYPDAFKSALFFGDTLRKCIWAMPISNNAVQANLRQTFAKGLQGGPVDLKVHPRNHDLFYVDINTSTVRRIKYQP